MNTLEKIQNAFFNFADFLAMKVAGSKINGLREALSNMEQQVMRLHWFKSVAYPELEQCFDIIKQKLDESESARKSAEEKLKGMEFDLNLLRREVLHSQKMGKGYFSTKALEIAGDLRQIMLTEQPGFSAVPRASYWVARQIELFASSLSEFGDTTFLVKLMFDKNGDLSITAEGDYTGVKLEKIMSFPAFRIKDREFTFYHCSKIGGLFTQRLAA